MTVIMFLRGTSVSVVKKRILSTMLGLSLILVVKHVEDLYNQPVGTHVFFCATQVRLFFMVIDLLNPHFNKCVHRVCKK